MAGVRENVSTDAYLTAGGIAGSTTHAKSRFDLTRVRFYEDLPNQRSVDPTSIDHDGRSQTFVFKEGFVRISVG